MTSEKVVCKICEKAYKCKGDVSAPLNNHLKTHSEEYHEFDAAITLKEQMEISSQFKGR